MRNKPFKVKHLLLAAAMMMAASCEAWPDPWRWDWGIFGERILTLAVVWLMVWAAFDE